MTDLTAERLRELLHYDPETGHFTWLVTRSGRAKAGTRAGTIQGDGYLQTSIDGRRYLNSRLAWLYMTGEWPVNFIDHRDIDRLNNRFANLRDVTRTQNAANSNGKGGKSGFKGVFSAGYGGKYIAMIKHQGKITYLGTYETAELASVAYQHKAKELHGEFARAA